MLSQALVIIYFCHICGAGEGLSWAYCTLGTRKTKFYIQRPKIDTLTLSLVGKFTPQKLSNVFNQSLLTIFSDYVDLEHYGVSNAYAAGALTL